MASPFLAIVGPTASGKTALGLRLARERNGEIISVDSRQVYRFLSIGTAKPPGMWSFCPEQTDQPVASFAASKRSHVAYLVEGIRCHLVDCLDPDTRYTAATFVRDATEKVREIRSRGKNPIFVGGTGLYFKALVEGLAPLPPADPVIRARLTKEAEDHGRHLLHDRLRRVDPVAAEKIPANNIQRLVRALEVYELTGKPISEWHREHAKTVTPTKVGAHSNDVHLQFIGPEVPRPELIHRIEARCRTMLESGMIEETQALVDRGYAESCPALSGLGYPRVIAHLKGTLSKDECLQLLIQDTRQYAKRQMTWFRHQLPVEWKSL